MNVTMISASVSRLAGGVSPAVRGLAQALAREGSVRVTVLGLQDAFTDVDRAEWAGVDVKTCTGSSALGFGYAPNLFALAMESQADLVHTHGLWMYPSVVANRWGRQTRRPHMVSPHGMLDPWALRHSGWKKRVASMLFERSNLKTAACLHALCDAEAECIRRYGLKNPIAVISNGVTLSDGASGGEPSWRRGIPADARVLLYVGRLHPKKGLDALVMAWARRERQDAASMASWRLVLAGWDQDGYEAKLRVLAAELDVGDKIHFVGPVFDAEKRMSFAAADAVILPSLSEGLPMTVLEAWSHGKPVLMTEACNLPRGLQAGAALRLCPGPEGIAEGIEEFVRMTDPERMVMGERGLMLVKNHLQWPQLAERMRSVYAWLMGMGDRPEWVAT